MYCGQIITVSSLTIVASQKEGVKPYLKRGTFFTYSKCIASCSAGRLPGMLIQPISHELHDLLLLRLIVRFMV